jgi:hypothetical protein
MQGVRCLVVACLLVWPVWVGWFFPMEDYMTVPYYHAACTEVRVCFAKIISGNPLGSEDCLYPVCPQGFQLTKFYDNSGLSFCFVLTLLRLNVSPQKGLLLFKNLCASGRMDMVFKQVIWMFCA